MDKNIKAIVLEYINDPPPWTDARNRMGCSENWYNSYYAISQTFDRATIQSMSEVELERLVKLADTIGEALY